jgi:hypothetical protein
MLAQAEMQIHRMARMDMTFTSVAPKADALERPFWTDSRRSLNLARACHITVLTRKVANGWKPKRGADHQIKLCRELVTSKDGEPGRLRVVTPGPNRARAEISLRGCLLDACAPCIGTPRYHSCKTVKVLAKRNESTPRVSFLHSPRVRPVVIGVLGWSGLGEGCRITRIRRLGTDV